MLSEWLTGSRAFEYLLGIEAVRGFRKSGVEKRMAVMMATLGDQYNTVMKLVARSHTIN